MHASDGAPKATRFIVEGQRFGINLGFNVEQ